MSRGASVTERYPHARCRISRYLDSMKALRYNPHVTIQIALAGNAADLIKHHVEPRKGVSSYSCRLSLSAVMKVLGDAPESREANNVRDLL